jgi:integrase
MAGVSGSVAVVERARGPQFYARYRLADGKQVQRRLGPAWTKRGRPPEGYMTRAEAEARLQALLEEAERGLAPIGTGAERTFGDACEEWLRYIEHDRARAPTTLRDYRRAVDGYLLPELGADTPLAAITTETIDALRERTLASGRYSRRTLQKQLVLLHGILKRAKRKKWITANPATDAERIAVTRSGDFNVLTPDQVLAVAGACADELEAAAILVAAFTGLRLGELRALRWRDVRFADQIILVRKSLPAGEHEEGPPKSGKVRQVPLVDQAAKALDGLSRREWFTEPGDLVFTVAGEHIRGDVLRQAFYDALDAVGLGHLREQEKPIVWHDLRHTFATLGAAAYDLRDLQGYMGHADIDTTMIYTHHVPRHDAADALTRVIGAALGDEGRVTSVSRTGAFGEHRGEPESTEPCVSVAEDVASHHQ